MIRTKKKKVIFYAHIRVSEDIVKSIKKEVFDDVAKEITKPIKVQFCSRNRKPQTRVFGRINLPDWFKKLEEKHLQNLTNKSN